METTVDKLLNGRIEVEQPAKGYRIAVDTILLAASVPALAGQKVLELGCGVGGVLLALARRVPDISASGVEIQPDLAELCAANIRRNGLEERLSVLLGDVAALPEEQMGAFDHVFMNPPYHDPKNHTASAQDMKRIANTESFEADLSLWIAAAAKALKEGGVLTMIHRADREEEIVSLLAPLFGAVRVTPICPKKDTPPRRVIIRAKKSRHPREGGGLGPQEPTFNQTTLDARLRGHDTVIKQVYSEEALMRESPLILHEENGSYTAAADLILRDMQPIC